jgi:hypothetical protein
MEYILGMESQSGKAALQGSIVHQTLEWMIRLSKRGKTNVDPMWLLHRAWDELVIKSPTISIRKVTTRIDKDTGGYKEAADFKRCRMALEHILNNKFYNPYKTIKILGVEQWFELEMPGEEWKCIDKDGEEHQFTTRGLIDLVHEIDEDTIEIVDWKTGQRKSFYSQKPIDEEVLMREVQPRLYHLAAFYLYPQYKNIWITFYYANDGGPITISLCQNDIPMTMAGLHRFLTTINKDTLIRRNKSWQCRMCSFYKNDTCTRVWSDLHTLGGHYVADKYTKLTYEGQAALGKPVEIR